MEHLHLEISIERAVAINAASPDYGCQAYPVGQALLEALSPEERDWLAGATTGYTHYSTPSGQVCAYRVCGSSLELTMPVSLESVVSALRVARVRDLDKRAKREVERAAGIERLAAGWLAKPLTEVVELFRSESYSHRVTWEVRVHVPEVRNYSPESQAGVRDEDLTSDPRVKARMAGEVAARTAELEAEAVRLNADLAAAKAKAEAVAAAAEAEAEAKAADNLRTYEAYLDEHGTESQKDREANGRLPVQEILDQRKAELLPDLRPYERITREDVEHSPLCDESEAPSFRAWDYDGPVSAETWAEYMAIEYAVKLLNPDGTAAVKMRAHRGVCPNEDCTTPATERLSALATVIWAGHKLQREYALPGTPISED